jgi:hypothetical protein
MTSTVARFTPRELARLDNLPALRHATPRRIAEAWEALHPGAHLPRRYGGPPWLTRAEGRAVATWLEQQRTTTTRER